MNRNTRSKFSQKILKNIEKTYHSSTDKEDIYRTFAPNVINNKNRKMSNMSTTNNNNSQKTAEPALTSPSQISSSVEQVPGNNSPKTRDSTPYLPNAPIVETIDEMEIEVTNNNDTQQLSEGSNPSPMEEIPMIDNIFSASNTQVQTSFEGFEDKAAADYLLEQDWCLAIEDSVARILPGNPKHPIYTQRTSSFYKITGLPLNTNARDLSPLVTHLKGRTCTFTQTSRSSFFKNAFIYVHPNDIKKDYTTITGTKFGEHTIFIFPHTNTKKTCNVCGNHTHEYKNCTSTDFVLDKNERKIFKKRFIIRNKDRILINETTRQNYNHVIKLSKDNPGNSNGQSRPQPNTRGKQKQTYNNTTNHLDRTHQKPNSSWSQQQLPKKS
ncbi:unnamed protein product [Rhizophagus irregularis]|nr:unnamed protein product [Rhizophagus irregularis]